VYLLKLALRPWRMAPLSQVFSAVAVGMLLLLGGFLFWMESGLNPVLNRLKTEQVITAYLDPSLDAKDEAKMLETVSDSLKISVGSKTIQARLVGTQQFVQELKGHYPDLGSELENLGNEANQVIPRYISISGLLPEGSLEKVKAVSGIESVESSKDRYRHILGAFQALKWVARLFVAGLAFALLTGLLHLARMNAYLHQDALSILKLWGATAFGLRIPGLLSGLWVGMLGGIIAACGWISGADWFAQHVFALSPLLKGMNAPGLQIGFGLFVIGSLMGLLAGSLGSSRRA
jgi:cell division transport system permease protein